MKYYAVHRSVPDDELQHYGVLGMKWGIRRGKLSGTYEKASKKKAKLEAKVEKYRRKKLKNANPIIRTSISDGLYRNNARKEDKYIAKAEKWMKAMEKEFSKTKLSQIENKNLASSERYAQKALKLPASSEKKRNAYLNNAQYHSNAALEVKSFNEKLHGKN